MELAMKSSKLSWPLWRQQPDEAGEEQVQKGWRERCGRNRRGWVASAQSMVVSQSASL